MQDPQSFSFNDINVTFSANMGQSSDPSVDVLFLAYNIDPYDYYNTSAS